MRTTTWRAILLLWVGLSVLAGCRHEEPYEKPLTPVRVQTVQPQETGGGVHYSASITPYMQVRLAFKVSGYVREIRQLRGADGRMRAVQEGDTLTKGTVLARVQEADYQAKVAQAKAQLAQGQAALEKGSQDFKRAAELFAAQSMTAPDYDAAKQEFESAKASVAGARAQLTEAELNLRSCALATPIDGVVLQRTLEVGTLVGPETIGFVLADLSSVKAVFGVPDVMLQNLQLGGALTITTESLRDTKFAGRLTAIAPAANERSRIFDVEMTVPNPHNQLKAGMIASLQIADQQLREPGAVVPLTAIVRSPHDPHGYALFVVEERDGTSLAHLRPVQLGEVYGNRIIVAAGVQVGERIVVTGATLVVDGERVRIIP
ncbi:MAG: efflux RND transporter periplasmic adaptor subunit [Deltaproteobacteria bacterium]|nr:efflux RND transporter periplasmic adaptor subunit [Deltaproteobacteria bacterium]